MDIYTVTHNLYLARIPIESMDATQLPDITAIRNNLKNLKIQKVSQKTLEKYSGVKQSVISRIQKGEIQDPSYNTIRKLLIAFNQLGFNQASKRAELTAKMIMNKNVVSVRPYNRLKEAWAIMNDKNFSQIPVIDERNRVVGSISESFLALHPTSHDMDKRIDEIDIEDPFPMVGKNELLSILAPIIISRKAVLVVEKTRAIGIITEHDIIEKTASQRNEELPKD